MKQMLKNITQLVGEEKTLSDIYSIRDPKVQEKLLDVPENYLGWHAYHFFKFTSEHDSVLDSEELIFKRHGGECYREGSMRALNYLIYEKLTPGRYTMENVLKAGY